MDRLLKKVIAVLLVFTMAGANLSILGMYGIAYALTEAELAEQTTTTQSSNVEFNSYLENGGHTKTEEMNSKTAKLFINVKVKNAGYLKNGVIQLQNTNFVMGKEVNSESIQSIDSENNRILLKQLNNGSDITIEIPVTILNKDKVAVDHFAKESTVKLTGTYIDNNGKEKNISKEIVNKLSWHGTAEAVIRSELTKYIPYSVDKKNGVMLQTKVNLGIKDSTLPIKKSELNVQVPEINGIKPTDVKVIANHTRATNGKTDGIDFTQENYTYNAETGIVQITTENVGDEISWLKKVEDEYLVTFIFDNQEVYEEVNKNGVNTIATANGKVEVYNDEETIIEVPEVETEIERTEKLGTMLDFDVVATSKISKGQIYANYDVNTKKETEYLVRYGVVVNSSDLTDKIELLQKTDKFVDNKKAEGLTTVSGRNYVYNKIVSIDTKVFKKILGEEGTVDLYNVNKKIGTINKETEVQDGKYVLDIAKIDNNALRIVTSKPITEGELVIDVTKAVKTDVDYGKAQLKTFEKIKTELEGTTDGATVSVSSQIALEEVKSVAEVSISKTDLTTVVKNENVEIRATLDTSSVYNALFKNPTLKITLPSHISKVDIKKYDILMANGLKIKGTPKVTTENGAPVIFIELEGNNEEYTIDAEYKGTIIVLNTDITVKTLTPSGTNKITMEYTNENEVSTNNKGNVETKVNFVAPVGIVAANGILNFAEGKNGILSISDKSIAGDIKAYSDKKVATVYGKIINNYGNNIDNVVILGRLPVKDNKELDGTDSLGSTFTATLNSRITVKGIDSEKYTVYYSENVDATTDLSNANNGWSTTATTGTKSYMIVTKGYEMAAGEVVEFSYNVEIPANLKHNNEAYQMYKVYYNNVSTIGKMAESKLSSVVGISTGQGPELTAEVSSTEQTVKEGQFVKMQVTVKNTGSTIAENVKVNIDRPEYARFANYASYKGMSIEDSDTKVIDIGRIEAGKSETVSYYLKLDEDTEVFLTQEEIDKMTDEEYDKWEAREEYPKQIANKVTISADKLSGNIPSNEYMLNLYEGKIAIDMVCKSDETAPLHKGDSIQYIVNIKNISNEEDLTGTVVEVSIPEQLIYKSAKIVDNSDPQKAITEGITFDPNTHILTISIGTLHNYRQMVIDVEAKESTDTFSVVAKVKANDTEEHISNVIEHMSEKVELEISELTATPKYVKESEYVTYHLKITNKGKSVATRVKVEDILPDGLIFEKATYSYNGKTNEVKSSKQNQVTINIGQLQSGESTDVSIVGRATLLSDKNDKEIKNQVSVTATSFDKVTTNTVTNIIEYDQKVHEQGGNKNPVTPATNRYKITGTAWIDENKNGKRDDNEQVLSNVSVMLLNKKNNTIVKDPDTKKEKRTTTGSNGKYEFSNLPKGEYIVIFLYDASRYSVTTYQEKGVDSSLNSDAININITIDGVRTIAGTTDAIKITNENARDIDIGLYSSEKFDLKLDKYISKITRTTPTNGTKTYEYDKTQLAKVEVLGQNLGKSSIVIEYKIAITNEGAIPGYAKKIVDYLPKGVGFSTELNKDWYLSENGNLYNASLANTIIKPGETKEVTLVVTRKITEDSLGSLYNSAEIYESYNEQGLQDMDSTPANKAQDEDDMSQAGIILSIVTGKIITYTTITLGVITILGFGIFAIKRKVLDKRNK